MLSRVAQNIYWMSRYIERTEGTARIISVNANLLLDLPPDTSFGWEPLIFITGGEQRFFESYNAADEPNVIRFLVCDEKNPSSIIACLTSARENLRTTRDVVPREAWEQVNDLFLFVRDHLQMGMSRRGRYEFLKHIIQGVQQVTGLLAGTMSHTYAYDFVRVGRNLERADMTSRILDVRSGNILPGQSAIQVQGGQTQEQTELNPFENIQWMSVLKSLSAYQMYRQQVRVRVRGSDVIKFLLQDPWFPRTVCHCLGELEKSLSKLPKSQPLLEPIAHLKQRVSRTHVADLDKRALHTFVDEIQRGLGAIHQQMAATYFGQ